ncbi:helix-turn-helix domain-containing protein [Lactobacillus sp. R2/2]|nr:helix-turn-helix domain-containing protein [Lactobacillus sp. R2/2]
MGVTERTIISVENGKYKPSLILAYKLAQVLELILKPYFVYRNI